MKKELDENTKADVRVAAISVAVEEFFGKAARTPTSEDRPIIRRDHECARAIMTILSGAMSANGRRAMVEILTGASSLPFDFGFYDEEILDYPPARETIKKLSPLSRQTVNFLDREGGPYSRGDSLR